MKYLISKLDEMWEALAAYQPQADADGHGKSWAKMCREKNTAAAYAAYAAAAAAADAGRAANRTAADTAYGAAVAADAAAYAKNRAKETIDMIGVTE